MCECEKNLENVQRIPENILISEHASRIFSDNWMKIIWYARSFSNAIRKHDGCKIYLGVVFIILLVEMFFEILLCDFCECFQ